MRWKVRQSDEALARDLAENLGLPEILARLLAQRGVNDAEATHRFLHPSLAHLHSPYEMLGMAAAVERLERAIAQKENILIYGDYDVDGTVAVVILKTCIELLGGIADFHVPHRIREGYGMRDDVIERAAAGGVSLVISVDTGIRAFQAAETAKRLGLDLIVTDHHLPESSSGVPPAIAVLNPNQRGCTYPSKELCGAGVAFKLAQALLTRAGREALLPSFLKMVAIATIADAVSLTAENRVIAKLGLDGLRQPVNGGLKALMEVAELHQLQRRISGADVAFRLAPRINAAGRMDVAKDVVELFTSKDQQRHRELATKLNELNACRQTEERRIVEQVARRLEEEAGFSEAFCLVIEGEDWHRGVIGIVATRVVERTGKPALVITKDTSAGEAHGSGRSIPGFHLLQALESEGCRGLFTRFGGHAHAVGFSLPCESVLRLRAAIEGYAKMRLTAADFAPSIEVDSELDLPDVTPKLMAAISMLEPFGAGNREPVFLARGLRILQPPRVMKDTHIKLRVRSSTDNSSRPYDAIGWRMADRLPADKFVIGDLLDAAFTLSESTNPDFPGICLELRDAAARCCRGPCLKR